ncbi:MAG: DUF3943 domain-containing protein [bacterium]
MRLAVISLTVGLLASSVCAQSRSTDFYYTGTKRPGFAFAEIVTINTFIWAWGHYVLDGYWTNISWKTAEESMRHGFEWDPNQFFNNFFSHPYHGNTYFNAARTNGMNFWESSAMAMAGSGMWEMFMESEFPAFNDWVMTTLGGIALGEGTFRFSSQVLDDRAAGWDRVWREALGFGLNPVGGFNRLVSGQMFRRSSTLDYMRNPINGFVAIGGRGTSNSENADKVPAKPTYELLMTYGEPFKDEGKRRPFDYFTFRVWFNRGKDVTDGDATPNLIILERGVLLGKNYSGGGGQQHLLGLMQNYDMLNNEVVKIGALSLGGALMSKFPMGGGFDLVTIPQLGVIVLGASNTEYIDPGTEEKGRTYNYSTGFKGGLVTQLHHRRYGSFLLSYNYWGLNTVEGAPGSERLHVVDAYYKIPVWKDFGLGVEGFLYHRNANYDTFPDVSKEAYGFRGMLTYDFGGSEQ